MADEHLPQFDRRQFLATASAVVADFSPRAAHGESDGRSAAIWSLREIAARGGLIYGAAGVSTELVPGSPLARLYADQVGILVPDYELKWSAVRPDADRFSFAGADKLLIFAQQNNMLFRGHCLAWEESNPSWLKKAITPANAEKLLTAHVDTIVRRYAGRVHSWDVVNEPIWFEHGKPNGLRDGVWLENLGEQYIDIAFHAARAADPNAILVLNEAGTETESSWSQTQRRLFLQLLDRLKSRDVPVDTVGLECHLSVGSIFDSDSFREYLDALSSRGVRILISELDVSDLHVDAPSTVARDLFVADIYKSVANAAVSSDALIGILTWELSDRSSWMRHSVRADGSAPRPLPYDAALNPKPARAALANALLASSRKRK